MATHSSVLAWRIPGTGEPGGLPCMGSHRVGHDWRDLAAAAAAVGDGVMGWLVSSLPPAWQFIRWSFYLSYYRMCPYLEICVCVCVCVCVFAHTHVRAKSLQFWLFATLWMVAQPSFSVHGSLQARILAWVAMPFSRGSSRSRDWTHVSCGSCIAGRFWATREAQNWIEGHCTCNQLTSGVVLLE